MISYASDKYQLRAIGFVSFFPKTIKAFPYSSLIVLSLGKLEKPTSHNSAAHWKSLLLFASLINPINASLDPIISNNLLLRSLSDRGSRLIAFPSKNPI